MPLKITVWSAINTKLSLPVIGRERCEPMPDSSLSDVMQKLFASDGRLVKLLMEDVPEFLFVKNRDLRFVEANKSYLKLLGMTELNALAGKTDFDLIPAAEAQGVHDLELRCIATGVPAFSIEQTVSNAMGGVHWLCGHRIPIKDSNGEVVGLVGLVRNVTAVKKVEQELRNANMRLSQTLTQLKQTQQKIIQHERLNALGEMASGVAHDFNNALMPILGYADVMISRPELLSRTEESLGMLKDIRIAAMDAAQAVRRLREFYRTASEDEKYKGDLNKQIETAVILTRPRWQSEMGAKGIKINVTTDLQEIDLVNAKESQLREIIINLILNAVDAMPQGGTISITTRKDGAAVLMEVCDTGEGMTEEVRHRCFEPFFTTKGDEGTGLGLSMAYGFVKRQNGMIDVVSAPGKGSRVIIRLPAEAPSAAVLEPDEPVTVIPVMKILVIDDEPYARKLFDMYLRADRHVVDLAANGREGLEKFSCGSYDLVVTDRAMPDMSGDQVVTTIRAANSRIPVIMITGFGDIMIESEQCPEGVDVVVCKPVSHRDLQRAIAKALASRQPA